MIGCLISSNVESCSAKPRAWISGPPATLPLTESTTPREQHPNAVDQPSFADWNGKQARGYGAADGNWGYGPVYRSTRLDDRIRSRIAGAKKITPPKLVDAMEDVQAHRTPEFTNGLADPGYVHDFVNHTKKEYVRGDVHENRAECLFSLLKSYLRVFRGVSKTNLPGYLGFFQFLRNFHQLTAFEQAEMILYAALEPSIASKAKKGEFVKCLDHFDLLQTAIN